MTNHKRVAVVAASAPPYGAGGVASAHYNLFRALQHAGLEVRLFTFDDEELGRDQDIVRNGTPRWQRRLVYRLNWLLAALLQPGKQVYQTRDILAAQGGARRMAEAIQSYAPDAIVLSDHGAPGLALLKETDTKMILISHHNPARFLDHPVLTKGSKLDVRLALRLEQRVVDCIDAVVCPSSYMRDTFEGTYQFDGPIQVIPNLLDFEWLEALPAQDSRPRMGLAAEDVLIYLPSAGSRLKGADYLPKLIRCLAAARQDPIGFYLPGHVEPETAKALASLPDNVRLYAPGQQIYAELVSHVKACSFGVSPSLKENYSMALLEAVHCGVPMLAFDTGGNRDIIRDGRNGYLVPEGDGEALCSAAVQ